jgi:hypothetical protein
MSTLSSVPNILGPKDNTDTMPSDDGGKNPGEALSKFDFSHIDPGSHTDLADLGSQGPDHSDAHAELASMSSEDALDYAISHIGPTDHLDGGHLDEGHFDMPADSSHDA